MTPGSCSIPALLAFAGLTLAYDPPVDTAGPLTVRMQPPAVGAYGAGGYAPLSRAGVPFLVPVSLQNNGDAAISGTLRVAVTDQWTVEPAGTVRFQLQPRGRSRHEFTLRFGAGTYNAHYPVHAYAEFEYQGRKFTAHPVLIVEPRIPDLPRAKLPVAWNPVSVPRGGALGLWRNPVRRERVGIVSAGAEAGQTAGEVFDAAPVILYGAGRQAGRTRPGIHMSLGPRPPSSRENVEAASVEYPLALPEGDAARLEVAICGSDSFRVEAAPFEGGAGETLYEGRGAAGGWQAAQVDLAKFAGKAIWLRLEARGASGEASWGEPSVVAGEAARASAFPPEGAAFHTLGQAGGCQVRLWPGARGLLDAPIGFLCGGRRLFLHGFRVRAAGDALEDPRSASELIEAREEPAAAGRRVRHRFRNWAGNFDVLVELNADGAALAARFWLENAPAPQPWFQLYLEGVSAGEWSEEAVRVYAGPGNVIVRPQAFRLAYNGHNLATSFVGFDFANGQAMVQHSLDIPDALEVDPRARLYSLVTPHAQTIEFYPAAEVFAAVKTLRERDTRQPSPGVAKLAGRFTFDLWSGRYRESAEALERAAQYGVKDALVVWHRWQRWGYDYRLPDVYPPDPQLGTLEEFRRLVETCKRSGTLFAPHDNYIDLYPDAEGFSYGNVVFRQNGAPFRAWFNYGREAQSYRARPDRLLPLVKRNLGLIKEGFAPTAYFIDVWSSTAPYDYWTGDGKFASRLVTQHAWGEIFAWIREHLGGAPQLSEAGHDKLIGWLDGADAQHLRVDPKAASFTWRIECADSERIPWIDAAWHDKFILHGAGYEGRYAAGLDAKEHGAYSDDYMSVEVLTGRPAMAPQAFSRNVIRKHWLLDAAMRALALDRIAAVEFAGGDIHRQHVRWERGARVWVNRGAAPWTVEGRTLPRYGFYLRAGEVEAAVELRGGRRLEWSRSPQGRYEEGRLTLASGEVRELPPE